MQQHVFLEIIEKHFCFIETKEKEIYIMAGMSHQEAGLKEEKEE